MADPLASRMWASLTEPQHVDHVVVDMDVFDRAAEVQMSLMMASSDAVVQQGHEDVMEDSTTVGAASGDWDDEDDPFEFTRSREIHEARAGEEQRPCIWTVHPTMKEQEKEAYEPKLVSIGPLHHGKQRLKPMEKTKKRYMQDLLERSPKTTKNSSNYARAILQSEQRARKQYSEEVPGGSKAFVKMLVVDGCFIIEYFLKRFLKQKPAQPGWDYCDHPRRDLMLLENQIPFFVLATLFELTTIPSEGTHQDHHSITLMEIALKFLKIEIPIEKHPKVEQVHHLLHLQHLCLNPQHIPDEPRHCSFVHLVGYPFKVATSSMSMVFYGMLYLLLIRKWPWRWFNPKLEQQAPRTIPCATELLKSGVKFKKKMLNKDQVRCYLKVSFTEGTLEIPFSPIEESTSSKLRNFIALEQHCPQVGSHFTSYAIFMHNIINTESDVAILREHKIIEHKLGNDKEVAKMFTTLSKGTRLDYEEHYNASLFKNVKEYSEVPHHGWRASLRSMHLSNPWTTISLVAGILVFGLALVQAYAALIRRRN